MLSTFFHFILLINLTSSWYIIEQDVWEHNSRPMEKWQALQSLHEDFNAKCMPNVDIFMDENDAKKKKNYP